MIETLSVEKSGSDIIWLQMLFVWNFLLPFLILLVGLFGIRFVKSRVVKSLEKNMEKHASYKNIIRRTRTLASLFSMVGMTFVWIIFAMLFLDSFGVDIRPLLVGAGALGLAIAFGTQTLIKDLVSGIFVLLEDQFSVGDRVKVGAFEGEVVSLSIRSTVLKSDDGAFIFLSNGSLGSIVNYSKEVYAETLKSDTPEEKE